MTGWHIAQMNVATALYPLDDPGIAEFVAALDEINALAEASPGFVWRLQGESGNATDIAAGDDPRFIVNMTVWNSVDALFDYVYKSAHRLVMARRRQWFAKPASAYQVLWWVRAGRVPTVEEGLERVRHLDAHGPTAMAFTFKTVHPPGDADTDPRDLRPDPCCVGWE